MHVSGVIYRHCGKSVPGSTCLKLYNILVKLVVKYGQTWTSGWQGLKKTKSSRKRELLRPQKWYIHLDKNTEICEKFKVDNVVRQRRSCEEDPWRQEENVVLVYIYIYTHTHTHTHTVMTVWQQVENKQYVTAYLQTLCLHIFMIIV
jgi:hypothetical protein